MDFRRCGTCSTCPRPVEQHNLSLCVQQLHCTATVLQVHSVLETVSDTFCQRAQIIHCTAIVLQMHGTRDERLSKCFVNVCSTTNVVQAHCTAAVLQVHSILETTTERILNGYCAPVIWIQDLILVRKKSSNILKNVTIANNAQRKEYI